MKNSQTVQLKNTGSAYLTISSATVNGPYFSSSAFSLPKTLAPGATTGLTVFFAPLATGSVSGGLVFKSSASDATLTVPLTGSGGTTTRSLSLSSSSLSFGNEAIGAKQTQTVSVKNTGNSTVTISAVSVSGSGFSASGGLNGATIAAGQSGTLTVTFAPQSTGLFTGTVTVSSNATNSPSSIATAGTGVSGSGHSVTLSWTASSTPGVAGYYVYRSTTYGTAYQRISTTLLTGLQYTDAAVSSGTTYYYAVTAVLLSGAESTYSASIAAKIP